MCTLNSIFLYIIFKRNMCRRVGMDNIKVNLKEVGWEDLNWIQLSEGLVVVCFRYGNDLWFVKRGRISWLSEQVLTFQEGICSEHWTFFFLYSFTVLPAAVYWSKNSRLLHIAAVAYSLYPYWIMKLRK